MRRRRGDDFIAEVTPQDKRDYISKVQSENRLVVMYGDRNNDAPALAQADVGVGMQTGKQAAQKAANIVDLDSDPTKLIVIIEIGKQLPITRGPLTTFAIATMSRNILRFCRRSSWLRTRSLGC